MAFLFLPYILSFFFLLLLVKVIGSDDEDARIWHIFVVSLFLTTLVMAFNFVGNRFFVEYNALLLMALVFAVVGFSTLLICKFSFWLPFVKSCQIAFIFVFFKIGLAFGFGYINAGKAGFEAQAMSLWKPYLRVPGVEKKQKDPGWDYYDLINVSVRLPGPPSAGMDMDDSSSTPGFGRKIRALAVYPRMKLRYDYWLHEAPRRPDQTKRLASAFQRLALIHTEAQVVERDEKFEMSIPGLEAKYLRILLDNPNFDKEPAVAYILSIVRGEEEWLFEVWGNDSEIERFSQHSFSEIRPLGDPDISSLKKKDVELNSFEGYPVQRTLTNAESKKAIDAIITGRNRNEVIFERNGSEFRYDMKLLSIDDQEFLQRLPVTE